MKMHSKGLWDEEAELWLYLVPGTDQTLNHADRVDDGITMSELSSVSNGVNTSCLSSL